MSDRYHVHSRVKVIVDKKLTEAYQTPFFIAICGECGEMSDPCDGRDIARRNLHLTSNGASGRRGLYNYRDTW